MLTLIAYAADPTAQELAMQEAGEFVAKLNEVLLFPLIYLLTGVALLVFVYGAAVYIMNADSDQAREQGKKHITFGIIGLVVMLSAYTILTIAAGTFSLNDELDCANAPGDPACADAFR